MEEISRIIKFLKKHWLLVKEEKLTCPYSHFWTIPVCSSYKACLPYGRIQGLEKRQWKTVLVLLSSCVGCGQDQISPVGSEHWWRGCSVGIRQLQVSFESFCVVKRWVYVHKILTVSAIFIAESIWEVSTCTVCVPSAAFSSMTLGLCCQMDHWQ